jgi:hypothetical protein
MTRGTAKALPWSGTMSKRPTIERVKMIYKRLVILRFWRPLATRLVEGGQIRPIPGTGEWNALLHLIIAQDIGFQLVSWKKRLPAREA